MKRTSLLVTGLLAGACAQALPPPGGVEDRMPPRIIGTTPDTLSVVEGLDGPVVFRFNERISERGVTNASALVSPRTGEVRVRRGREEIRVELEGGWKPGMIYRVVLLPGIRDLFGNEQKTPLELVFSTGPPIAGAVIAGIVTVRSSGQPARQAFVEATNQADSLTSVTAADSSSFYAFRYLAPGLYDLVAYADQNRNGRRDESEAASLPLRRSLNRDGDTVVAELAVVPPDTTPPRLTRGEVRDSQQIRLFSDDYLDPDWALELPRVRILSLPDSVEIPGPHALMTVDSFSKLPRPEPEPEPDSLRADSLRADTLVADTAARRAAPGRAPPRALAGRPVGPGAARPAGEFGAPAGPLPYQEFVLVPATPLTAGGRYLVEVLGLRNISARSGGGGTVEVEVPTPKAPPPPDTSAVRRFPRATLR